MICKTDFVPFWPILAPRALLSLLSPMYGWVMWFLYHVPSPEGRKAVVVATYFYKRGLQSQPPPVLTWLYQANQLLLLLMMWMVEQQQQNFQLNLHDDLHYFLLNTTSAISQIRPFIQPPLKRNRLSSNDDRHDQVDDHRAFISHHRTLFSGYRICYFIIQIVGIIFL